MQDRHQLLTVCCHEPVAKIGSQIDLSAMVCSTTVISDAPAAAHTANLPVLAKDR